MTAQHATDDERLVGSDRVLALLVRLAGMPEGASLDELATASREAKPTVHRGLAALVRAGLARKEARGRYILGDEFLRLAFAHREARPDGVRVRPLLERLADRFGETAHFAVLDGPDVVYREKVDPVGGSVRLTSTVGGRNPAHATGVGKALLAGHLRDLAAVDEWIGERTLERRTDATATAANALHERLVDVRTRGYALDAEENEPGIACLAVPISLGGGAQVDGAVSVSAVAYRTPLATLEAAADEILALVADAGLAVRRLR
jgi:DNA-binding IclR family transcriptional regulator